jgi:hypothetical protein
VRLDFASFSVGITSDTVGIERHGRDGHPRGRGFTPGARTVEHALPPLGVALETIRHETLHVIKWHAIYLSVMRPGGPGGKPKNWKRPSPRAASPRPTAAKPCGLAIKIRKVLEKARLMAGQS